MKFLDVGGATFHVEAALRPGRPTVVFANSLGSDLRIWDDVVAALAAADFGALRYDLRGHGLSDLGIPPRLIDDHADDLHLLMVAAGVDEATICGVSVGGAIALALASRHPECVRRLLLCDTGAKIGTTDSWNQRIAAVERGGVASVAEAILQRWFPPAEYAQGGGLVALCRNMLCATSSAGYVATCVALRDSDLTVAARRLTKPTLVLAGEFDGSTPPDFVRAFSAVIPHSRFVEIAGAGHLPGLQRPEAVTRELLAFLAEDAAAA